MQNIKSLEDVLGISYTDTLSSINKNFKVKKNRSDIEKLCLVMIHVLKGKNINVSAHIRMLLSMEYTNQIFIDDSLAVIHVGTHKSMDLCNFNNISKEYIDSMLDQIEDEVRVSIKINANAGVEDFYAYKMLEYLNKRNINVSAHVRMLLALELQGQIYVNADNKLDVSFWNTNQEAQNAFKNENLNNKNTSSDNIDNNENNGFEHYSEDDNVPEDDDL